MLYKLKGSSYERSKINELYNKRWSKKNIRNYKQDHFVWI